MALRAHLPYFPLYVNDFLGGTRFMSAAAVGCYIRLLCIEWESGPMPNDVDALDRVVPGTKEAWPELWSKFAVGADGKLRNARLEDERLKIFDLFKRRSKIGQSAAAARWQVRAGSEMPEAMPMAMRQAMPEAMRHACHTDTDTD